MVMTIGAYIFLIIFLGYMIWAGVKAKVFKITLFVNDEIEIDVVPMKAFFKFDNIGDN